MSNSAKHVITKIVALLASDYTSKYEIQNIEDVPYGQRIELVDIKGEETFLVTVQKRMTAQAIEAEVRKDELRRQDDFDAAMAARGEPPF